MESSEAKARIETVRWVSHVALLSFSRYRRILIDKSTFSAVFPGVDFENPTITHSIDEDLALKTTKKELTAKQNADLFTGWQIILGIVGMSSLFDLYLKSKADALTGNDNKSLGVFERFDRITKIRLKEQPFFEELRNYHAVRDISIHNRGMINQRYINKTASRTSVDTPYVYYLRDLNRYSEILMEAIDYIESETS